MVHAKITYDLEPMSHDQKLQIADFLVQVPTFNYETVENLKSNIFNPLL